MPIAIKAENISKTYQLGNIGTGTLSRDIERWISRMRGKEDPFLRIGEINDRTRKGESDIVWSLKDINFEIEQGDAVGIIGRNGAGKSTLLKILSRVTSPTTGTVKGKGRIASLLEVGTGFHPELTGRENIYLNGAILGMRKKEINGKFDEIVDFAGVGRYVDTPVKRYSSGMYVRLAFAVAAHLDSEILIVDEVLAVGDIEFQKKCLGRMNDVSKIDGRTVLFVSHNMQATATLCNKLILLNTGKVEYEGEVQVGINKYLSQSNYILIKENLTKRIADIPEDEIFKLIDLDVKQNGSLNFNFVSNEDIKVIFTFLIKKNVIGLRVGLDILEKANDIILFRTFFDDQSTEIKEIQAGVYKSEMTISSDFLKQGCYILNVIVGIHNIRWIVYGDLKVEVNINNVNGVNKMYADERPGLLMPKVGWINYIIGHS